MKKDPTTVNAAQKAEEMATLKMEKEALAQQVKRLIRTEGKLYAYQEELDAQLKEYKELYELNRKLNATFDVGQISEYVIAYVIYNLEYERVLIFQQVENEGLYAVCAVGGYYDEGENRAVAGLAMAQDDPFLLPILEGGEYIICKAGSEQMELAEYRARLHMNEYLIYPIGANERPPALLAVGNSAGNAEFYQRVGDSEEALLGMGNLVGLLSSSIENHIYYANMEKALEQERLAEEQLRGALREKETLLKEIHHRVKNNLQVISSMLHLQSARTTDKEVLMAFKESQSRVDTMALIHEKLYQSKNLTVIPMSGYIGDLITNLYMSFGINDEAIKAVIKVADVNLNVSTAIPCGLIINELVTNCLKHAFPGGRKGEIVLSLQPVAEGKYELIVSDNGIGFPENADFTNTETLGLKLVVSLISQLDGTIELDRTGGSTFTIRFSELLYKERG